MPKEAQISERTLVPLGLVGGALIALLGGAAWLTNLHFVATAAAQKVEAIEVKQISDATDINEKLDKVSQDLAEVKGQLSIMCEMLKAEKRRRDK
jgi:hypothetical protein